MCSRCRRGSPRARDGRLVDSAGRVMTPLDVFVAVVLFVALAAGAFVAGLALVTLVAALIARWRS